MTDLHKLSSEHALSLESLLVRHDVGAAVFFYNIDCRYLASSNTPLYYSAILLYLYSGSLFSPCQTCSIPPPASSINLAWTIKNLRKPPQHRPHLQRWFAAKRIWSRSSTITVQQEDLVWGNHCNAYQCGLVGHQYQQISCSVPPLQLL